MSRLGKSWADSIVIDSDDSDEEEVIMEEEVDEKYSGSATLVLQPRGDLAKVHLKPSVHDNHLHGDNKPAIKTEKVMEVHDMEGKGTSWTLLKSSTIPR